MKSNSQQRKALEERIAELEKIRDIVYNIEDTVAGIEREVAAIDESLPDGSSLLKLVKKAYALVDELLGPPEEEAGVPEELYSPEARGSSGRTISLEEVLRSAGNKTVS